MMLWVSISVHKFGEDAYAQVLLACGQTQHHRLCIRASPVTGQQKCFTSYMASLASGLVAGVGLGHLAGWWVSEA